MKKLKISSVNLTHGESDSSYQKAIESALRSVRFKPGANHIANIVIFGMGFENGKFKVALQIIFTETEEVEGPEEKKPSLSKASPTSTIRKKAETRKKSEQEKRKAEAERDEYHFDKNDIQYHPAYIPHHVFIEFNNHSISHVLETSLDNTWEIHPDSYVFKDIYDVIKPHVDLPPSQVRIYTEPVDDISVMVPTHTGFTRRFTGYMQALHDDKIAAEISLKAQPHRKRTNELRPGSKEENYNE